jgi:hypothetical protein
MQFPREILELILEQSSSATRADLCSVSKAFNEMCIYISRDMSFYPGLYSLTRAQLRVLFRSEFGPYFPGHDGDYHILARTGFPTTFEFSETTRHDPLLFDYGYYCYVQQNEQCNVDVLEDGMVFATGDLSTITTMLPSHPFTQYLCSLADHKFDEIMPTDYIRNGESTAADPIWYAYELAAKMDDVAIWNHCCSIDPTGHNSCRAQFCCEHRAINILEANEDYDLARNIGPLIAGGDVTLFKRLLALPNKGYLKQHGGLFCAACYGGPKEFWTMYRAGARGLREVLDNWGTVKAISPRPHRILEETRLFIVGLLY